MYTDILAGLQYPSKSEQLSIWLFKEASEKAIANAAYNTHGTPLLTKQDVGVAVIESILQPNLSFRIIFEQTEEDYFYTLMLVYTDALFEGFERTEDVSHEREAINLYSNFKTNFSNLFSTY